MDEKLTEEEIKQEAMERVQRRVQAKPARVYIPHKTDEVEKKEFWEEEPRNMGTRI